MDPLSTRDNIVCFIHSTTMNLHNTEILERIVLYLKDRDFFQYVERVIINNIGAAIDEAYFKAISEKIVVINYSADISLFECATIKQVITFAKIYSTYKILYLHTKGVSHHSNSMYFKNIVAWTNFMLYCLVDNADKCIKLLNNYDTVGCNFRKDEGPTKKHYSGNFWWATAAYLQRLKCMEFKEKHDAEFLILSQKPKICTVYTLEGMYETNYPLAAYKDAVFNSFTRQLTMSTRRATNIYYCKVGWPGIGLCNQLYSLISCIFKCIQCNNGQHIIVLDDFLTDITSNVYVAVDEIFDLARMNLYLQKYNICLLSKHGIHLRINSIFYGLDANQVDITHKVVQQYSTTNRLHIPLNTNLNTLYCDPCYGIEKQLYVTYTLNECAYVINEEFAENDEVNIDVQDFSHVKWHAQNGITKERQDNGPLISELLVNIRFAEKFHTLSNNFIASLTIQPGQTINILHLRNEADAIPFWGTINQMSPETYKTVLENKYIYLLEKYIDKKNLTIILSTNTANKVVDFMESHHYPFVFCDKTLVRGREENAIVDLLNGTHCNAVYIGNVNLVTYHGSTFSFVLYKLLEDKPGIKKVLIDLDHITDAEVVI